MHSVAILFGVVIAFTGCAIGWTIVGEQRRRARVHEAATGLGLQPIVDAEQWLRHTGLSRIPLFALAELGARVRVSNVFEGEVAGTSIALCDYTRASGTGSSRFEVRETVACLPGMSSPNDHRPDWRRINPPSLSLAPRRSPGRA